MQGCIEKISSILLSRPPLLSTLGAHYQVPCQYRCLPALLFFCICLLLPLQSTHSNRLLIPLPPRLVNTNNVYNKSSSVSRSRVNRDNARLIFFYSQKWKDL